MSQDQTPATPRKSHDHRRDELVVDSGDLRPVADMLAGLGITWALKDDRRGNNVDLLAVDDRARLLGLARLRQLQDADQQPLDVGDVLAFVRQRFAADRDGWTPVMGKNRFIDGVIGEGHKPHAGSDPVPVETPVSLSAPQEGVGPGSGVTVGMIDTKRDLPALAPGGVYPFRAGHGRFVADLIRQQAPGVTLESVDVLKGHDARADSWTTAKAIVQLAEDFELDVLNLSLGCYTMAGGPPLVISRAIERLDPRILVIAAAGNHGNFEHLARGRDRRSAIWPAALPRPIAVGAVDAEWKAPDPGWSPTLPWVDVVALGVDVVAKYVGSHADPVKVELFDGSISDPFTGYASWSGTSFAAANLSGAVAAAMTPGGSPYDALADLLKAGSLVKEFDHGSWAENDDHA